MGDDKKEVKQETTKQQEKSDNEWPSARLMHVLLNKEDEE